MNLRLNMEAAQLVVGAAILDPRFRDQLIDDRAGALRAVDGLPVAPDHVRLMPQDRRALGLIRADSLQDFALGVERLRRSVQPAQVRQPAASGELLFG